MRNLLLITFFCLFLFSCIDKKSDETTISSNNQVFESNINSRNNSNSENISIEKNFKNYITEPQNFKLIEIVKGLNYPWGMTFLDDYNMLITEKSGKIIRINLTTNEKFEIQHNINFVASGQGGLLDVLFNDDFIYFSFSENRDSGKTSTSISRGKLVDDKIIELESIFQAEPPIIGTKHFGSRLLINNQMLFATIGERDQGMIAQDATKHPGSIIRINLDGSIPKTNPKFINNKEWLPEIFQIGIRNPQGMALSPFNNKIYISNHGPKGGDFIGEVTNGGNYGWKEIGWGGTNYSGSKIGTGEAFNPKFTKPILTWVPSIAPSGIMFYKGNKFKEWEGDLLVTSLKYNMLIKINMENNQIINETILIKDKIVRIRDLEIDTKGNVYLISDQNNSSLWKLTK
jgi:quinoprotein glucose dehydrogenase